jgi:hypothetical protein
MHSGDSDGPGSTLVAALDATGVPSTIKGKVQRAILRFIAGGIGFETWQQIRENLDTIEGRSRVNMMLAEHVGKQALADPEMVERAKARFLGDLVRKQENVEAVARLANEAAESAPDADQTVEDGAKEPTQDWMNSFIREAENASSDELRARLAGVLAGEARKPGTFSRSTVRFIAEVDKETLEALQRVLQYAHQSAIFKEESWSSGEWFAVGSLLENAGLIYGVTGSTYQTWTIPADGRVFCRGQKLALMLEGQPGTEVRIEAWLMTKLGLEVASLLQPPDDTVRLKNLVKMLPKASLDKITLAAGVDTAQDGIFTYLPLKVEWERDTESTGGKPQPKSAI